MKEIQKPLENLEDIKRLISKLSNADIEDEENCEPCLLPTEIIIKILSFIDDVDDYRSCMRVSTEIRDLIYKTPEIMRKILISFKECRWNNIPMKMNIEDDFNPRTAKTKAVVMEPQLDFLEQKGNFFRCMDLKLHEYDEEVFKFIMNIAVNLEELDFEVMSGGRKNQDVLELVEEMPILKKLKTLKITHNSLKFFIKNTENVKNIQKLTIISPKLDSQELLTDFIIQQDNLQEFTLKNNRAMDIINFPTRDITQDVKFKLKKLNLCFVNNNRKHFMDFLQSQAEHLDELELNYKPHHEILEIVFKYCRKLSKLTLNTYGDSPVFSDLFPHWQLPTLRKYLNKSFSAVQVTNIFKRFPNLDSLVAWRVVDSDGTYGKLKSLEVGLTYYHQMKLLKLPDLKNYTITVLSGDRLEESWITCAKNVENVEHLLIKDFHDSFDVKIVIKNLGIFKNLKTFKLGSLKRIGYANTMKVALMSFRHQQFFNMIIDTEKKFIKYSKFMEIKFPDIFDILSENFKGYEMIQYNAHKY